MNRRTSGQVLYGINNIYKVRAEGIDYECRIKGKILKTDDNNNYYNPLTAGDIVDIEILSGGNQGVILSLGERKNIFTRWNKKRMALQLIAANIDVLFCITTPEMPPFRPRFIDRVLISAGELYSTAVIMNKTDLRMNKKISERLDYYKKIGSDVYYCSALENKGLEGIRDIVSKRVCAFVGQSGVGKSSIINLLSESAQQKTAEISEKYSRGRHTTNYSILFPEKKGGIIDTPGIREIFINYVKPDNLAHCFKDFRPFTDRCGFSSCSHTAEKECAVIDAVDRGDIHYDRYETYIKLFREMTEKSEEIYGKTYY